ncbi:MAG: hypothetical protein WEB30_17355 [Cyclobacteriaceae bacterium]
MKPFKPITGFLTLVVFFLALNLTSRAQVVVDKKNLNDDKELKYIQLMYFVDKGGFKPVFYVDYGLIEPEYTDILEPERDYRQKININGEEVNDRVTIVWLLNKVDKAGWEYMGDVVYLPLKMMDNWHVFTLKRKESHL